MIISVVKSYVHILYTKASNDICKYTSILSSAKKKKHLQKGEKFTLQSLDLYICT